MRRQDRDGSAGPTTPARKRSRLAGALVVVVAVMVALLLGEAAVRLVLPQNMSNSFFVENELGLPVNRDNGTARQQIGDVVVEYRFFEHHLRDSRKRDDRTNVLVLGDSFTFGMFLPAQATYVGRLQHEADRAFGDRINFMNAARGGMGVGEFAAFLEDFGDRIAPDALLVFLNVLDVDRGQNSPFYTFEPDTGTLRRVVRRPSLKARLTEVRAYQWLHLHSHLFQLVKGCLLERCGQVRSIEFVYEAGAADGEPRAADAGAVDNRKTEALYRRIRDWAAERRIPLRVVTTGWPQPSHMPHTTRFLEHAPAFFEAERIPFCDTRGVVTRRVLAQVRELEIPGDFHPNEQGAALIADGAWNQCLKSWLPDIMERSR